MAYEAYIATTNYIAQQVFLAWSTGADYEALMQELCKGSNVEVHHVKSKLTQLIKENHLNNQLIQA